jgi:zinc finger-like protein
VAYRDARAGVLGCQHYARAAMLVAPCCGRAFACRLCHDEAVGPGAAACASGAAAAPAALAAAPPSSSSAPAPLAAAHCGRRLDRYSVREMLCMLCGLRQAAAAECRGCQARLARYYCPICHLWEDGDERERPVYHCPFCNVCRRGRGLGVDVFHCMRCNACMSLSVAESHTCRERAMEGDCPVCGDALFDSAAPVKELPCAHLLHSACFAQHTRHSYQCPVCLKSAGDMTAYWRMLDSLLESERAFALPPEYRGRVQRVRCRDCSREGEAPWHFVYHACPHCRSYNTRVL